MTPTLPATLLGSRAAVAKANDGEPVSDGTTLAGAHGAVGIFSHAGEARSGNKQRNGVHPALELLRAFFDVGLEEELAAGNEDAGDLLDGPDGRDEAFGVSFLPPWVREMDEYHARRRGLQAGQGIARVLGEYAPST